MGPRTPGEEPQRGDFATRVVEQSNYVRVPRAQERKREDSGAVGTGEALLPSRPELLTDSIDFQGSEYQKVCFLLPQLTPEHRCHLTASEDLVGRLVLNKKYHLGAAETRDSGNERKLPTAEAATFARAPSGVPGAVPSTGCLLSPQQWERCSVSSPSHSGQHGLGKVK